MSKVTAPATSWVELMATRELFSAGQWIFRGETMAGRPFKTSLERVAVDRWKCAFSDVPDIEAGLLRRFRREASRYLPQVSPSADRLEWLAIMRHYGAPTRLLDWTYSFYVAAYFALSGTKPCTTCSIWAVDVDWIQKITSGTDGVLPIDAKVRLIGDVNAVRPETIGAILFRRPPVPLVYPVNPFQLHDRLVLQQGVFLVPGDVSKPFMENLTSLGDSGDHIIEIPLCITPGFQRKAVQELLRMNVSSATLFPGLDGFARHLADIVPFPELRAID